MFTIRQVLVALAGGASLATAQAALVLYSPFEGAWLKNPNEITYQATGVQSSRAASLTLSSGLQTQTVWWYPYNGSLLRQPLTSPLPNNSTVTVTLRDGLTTSTRTYTTAFPWTIPASIGAAAASQQFASFPAGYCTNFASRAFHANLNASYLPWKGDAKNWITNARAAGWKTTTGLNTTSGMIGAVMVWSSSSFGHVAVVVDMNRTGKPGEIEYTIQEMNWGAVVNAAQGITANFGKVTSTKLLSSSLHRSATMPFIGFILPVRQ